MWKGWFWTSLAGTLVLNSCAPPTAARSDGSTINNQGERVVIVKNPPGKSDAEYANEMANCEGFSRMHMNDKVNAYSGCMLYFNNLAQVGNRTLSKSLLSPPPASMPPQMAAGPNPWAPPGAPRQLGAPLASPTRYGERWQCPEGIELNIDRSEKVTELLVPLLDCDLVITNGVTGSFAGHCPFVSGNPLLVYRQFVTFNGSTIEFGYQASGAGAPHMALSDAAYARYTLNTRNGDFRGVTGGGDKASGICIRE